MSDYKNKKIIGTTSFGGTGGSAVTNILEEYSSKIGSLSGGSTFECKVFSATLFNLEIALRNQLFVNEAIKNLQYHAVCAIKDNNYTNNFDSKSFIKLTDEYINNVVDHWYGGIFFDKEYILLDNYEKKQIEKTKVLFEYLFKNNYQLYEPYYWRPSFEPSATQYFGSFTDRFYKMTQEYTSKVFDLVPSSTTFILVDSLFRPESVIHELNYFKDAQCTIVDRDPRDLYIINKVHWGQLWLPTWSVDTFIKWFKTYRSCNERNRTHRNEILQLQFEQLIYEYDNSIKKIQDFFNLKDSDHIRKGKIFIPEKSKLNTQQFRKYPQYRKDIEKIEKELFEFCYPYNENQALHLIKDETEISKVNIEPIEVIRKKCIVFQKTGKLPCSRYKAAFLFSLLIKSIISFKYRKNMIQYSKGVIKVSIGVIIFPFDFLWQLRSIKKYQEKNKDVVVEFK